MTLKRTVLLSLLVSGMAFADMAPVEEGSHSYEQWQLAQNESQTSYESVTEPKKDVSEVAEPGSKREDMQLLLNKLSALQQEVANLRGELEQQARAVSDLQSQRPQSTALQTQKQVEASSPSTSTLKESIKQSRVSGLSIEPKQKQPDEQASYRSAFELVKDRQYDDALIALKDFLHHFPSGKFAPNAQYWLGELYLLKRNYDLAFKSFSAIVNDFPDTPKKPSALYKLGVTYSFLGESQKAREKFLEVTKQYPQTAVARLAAAKLSEY